MIARRIVHGIVHILQVRPLNRRSGLPSTWKGEYINCCNDMYVLVFSCAWIHMATVRSWCIVNDIEVRYYYGCLYCFMVVFMYGGVYKIEWQVILHTDQKCVVHCNRHPQWHSSSTTTYYVGQLAVTYQNTRAWPHKST